MNPARRVPTAGLTVNLRVEGTGPPLLFLGGSNFDLSVRAPVFDSPLCDHFTVAAADPRGLGATDAPAGDWNMADYAADARDVIQALGWDTAFVLGESFGAMTALHLARLAPERVRQMALAAGAPGGAGGSSFPIETFLDIADPVEKARAALSILDTRFGDDPHAQDAKIRARIAFEQRFLNSHHNRAGYPRLLAARAGHDCWDALPEITIPTLIFAGEFDAQAPKQGAMAMSHALPVATLHLIPAGHNLCFASDQPADTLIKAWSAPAQGKD